MSAHVQLDTVCPNNHNLTVAISRDEFEAALRAGGLMLHCTTCDANWSPSKEEMTKLREQLGVEK
jgi:hypothetical protein